MMKVSPDMNNTAATPRKLNKKKLSPLAVMARDWPCFREVRPLKVGIRFDLIDRGADPLTTIQALAAFTSTREYYLACRTGTARVDWFGFNFGEVTEADQAHADTMLGLLDQIEACRKV